MTPHEAERIFAQHGVEASRLDESSLHRAWLRVARSVHPDGGGRHAEAASLNAAYAVLRERAQRLAGGRPAPMAAPRPAADDPLRDGVAVWAWAGATQLPLSDRIARADYSDRNYVKRQMWELSGRRTDEWTIWPFDGQAFAEPLTVYATSDQFGEMVRAAEQFGRTDGRPPLAVLAARSIGCAEAWLIGLAGLWLARPERHPVDRDPRSDQALLAWLRARTAR